MTFETVYRKYFESSRESGQTVFYSGGRLREYLIEAQCPTGPGVYVFETQTGQPKVRYIGMAGTWNNATKRFKGQGLFGRIRNKQSDEVPRQTFLSQQMKSNGWDYIRIKWCVLDGVKSSTLPAKAEADLMQAFFDTYGKLPDWNSEF